MVFGLLLALFLATNSSLGAGKARDASFLDGLSSPFSEIQPTGWLQGNA